MAETISSISEGANQEPEKKLNCPKVNIKLLAYKSFYFFFFSAAGSLFPYLAIFYKQLWLSAQQTGILIGIRPLLHLLSSSVWGIVADNFNKSKLIFLVAIVAWLCSNFSLSLVRHPTHFGPCDHNETTNSTSAPNVPRLTTESLRKGHAVLRHGDFNKSEDIVNGRRSRWSSNTMTQSELKRNQTEQNYKQNKRIFFILLSITVVGTLLAAPALPFADTATLQVLGEEKDFYGKQRQWGALGWGVSSFAVGALVSTTEKESDCNVAAIDVDYKPCFYAYAALMAIAFIPALFFRFEDCSSHFITNVLGMTRTLLNLDCVTFLLTILMFGCSWGLMQTFLLWHLEDLGGNQFLFSLIAVTQCLSELATFNFSGYLIKIAGHYRLLYCSLLYSSLRFTLYGVIKNPWLVLPIEFFHGFSTSLVWSVAVSFVSLKAGVAASMQGILTGIHWGLGLGGGAILCGLLINVIGSDNTFFVFGIIPLVNLVILVIIRNVTCKPDESKDTEMSTLIEQPCHENEASIPSEETAALKFGYTCCGLFKVTA